MRLGFIGAAVLLASIGGVWVAFAIQEGVTTVDAGGFASLSAIIGLIMLIAEDIDV